jgi:hypothetical protein
MAPDDMSEAPRPIRRWADRISIALAIGLVPIYIAAKTHFFLRFGEIPILEYLAEHWPFWAAALVVALLGNLFERVHGAQTDGQSNNELQRTRPAQAIEPRR